MSLTLPRSRRLFAVAFSVLVCQACSSPGVATSARTAEPVSASSSGPQSGESTAVPGAARGGLVVPAVVGLPPSPGDGGTYRIGPDDLLKIEVFEVDELSSEERVSEDGVIVMPLIGGVTVGGLTPREAEKVIADTLKRSYLQNPQVNIFVSEYASHDVTVTGAVEKPGVFPIKGRTTLLQALAMAGGFDELANEEEVVLFRGQGTSSAKAYVVDVERIQEGTLRDPVLVGNDRIVVPKSGTTVFLTNVRDTLKGFVSFTPLL